MDASVAAGMTPDIYTCSILVKGLARQSTPHKVCLETLHDGHKTSTSGLKGTFNNTVLETGLFINPLRTP